MTAPEAIDEAKWQQVYETYVEDKYQLDIKKKFREAKNMYAYQAALSRMLEVVRKGYWQPSGEVTEKLVREYLETIEEVGLSCNGNVCDNAPLTDFVNEKAEQIKGIPAVELQEYRQQLAALNQVDTREQSVPDPEKQIAVNAPDPNFRYQSKTGIKGYQVQEVSSYQSGKEKSRLSDSLGILLLTGLFITGFLLRNDWPV